MHYSNITYDIVYDIVYDIAYDITYDIVYNVICRAKKVMLAGEMLWVVGAYKKENTTTTQLLNTGTTISVLRI